MPILFKALLSQQCLGKSNSLMVEIWWWKREWYSVAGENVDPEDDIGDFDGVGDSQNNLHLRWVVQEWRCAQRGRRRVGGQRHETGSGSKMGASATLLKPGHPPDQPLPGEWQPFFWFYKWRWWIFQEMQKCNCKLFFKSGHPSFWEEPVVRHYLESWTLTMFMWMVMMEATTVDRYSLVAGVNSYPRVKTPNMDDILWTHFIRPMKVSPLCQEIATLEYYQSLSFNIKHLGRSFIYLLCARRVILKICKFVEAVEELQIFMRLQPKISQGNGIICLSSLIDIMEVKHLGVFFFVNHSLKLLGAF